MCKVVIARLSNSYFEARVLNTGLVARGRTRLEALGKLLADHPEAFACEQIDDRDDPDLTR